MAEGPKQEADGASPAPPSFALEPLEPGRPPRRRRPRLYSVAEQAYQFAIMAYAARYELEVLEGLAEWAWDDAGLARALADPFQLLRRHDVRFRPGTPVGSALAQLLHPPGSDEQHGDPPRRRPRVIVYRASRRRRALGLALLHEFAHWVFEEVLRCEYTEVDAWLLTLCLAFPRSELLRVRIRRGGWSVRALGQHQRFVEPWALAERARMARMFYRAVAA